MTATNEPNQCSPTTVQQRRDGPHTNQVPRGICENITARPTLTLLEDEAKTIALQNLHRPRSFGSVPHSTPQPTQLGMAQHAVDSAATRLCDCQLRGPPQQRWRKGVTAAVGHCGVEIATAFIAWLVSCALARAETCAQACITPATSMHSEHTNWPHEQKQVSGSHTRHSVRTVTARGERTK